MKKDNEAEHRAIIDNETFPCDRCGVTFGEPDLYVDSKTDAVYCQKCFDYLEAQG